MATYSYEIKRDENRHRETIDTFYEMYKYSMVKVSYPKVKRSMMALWHPITNIPTEERRAVSNWMLNIAVPSTPWEELGYEFFLEDKFTGEKIKGAIFSSEIDSGKVFDFVKELQDMFNKTPISVVITIGFDNTTLKMSKYMRLEDEYVYSKEEILRQIKGADMRAWAELNLPEHYE